MPRFSAAFSRRKSTADEVQNALMTPAEQHSFRVIERTDLANGKSFDGGARMARATGTPMTRPNHLDLDQDDNMFANLKGDRGVSNFTKASSADASSRHSNASTAPSSADMATTATPHEDVRTPVKQKNVHDAHSRRAVPPSSSSFLSKAGRTFSFGSKKASANSPIDDDVPDVPPIPTIQREDENGRSRGLTTSTTSTTTPPRLEGGGMDMGGDFGTMFSGSGFDKRASMLTLKNGKDLPPTPQGRQKQPATLSLDTTSSVDAGPLSWNSEHSNDNLLGTRSTPAAHDRPPPVPRHQLSFESRPQPPSPIDEDAKLLQDTMAATRFLTGAEQAPRPTHGRYRSEEDSFTVIPRRTAPAALGSGSHEDNMFAGTSTGISRQAFRQSAKPGGPAQQNKVMTPAEFERYRRHKEQLGSAPDTKAPVAVNNDDDDDDDINYDDDEDDIEKSKQQAKQRRKQEAHMAVYRQQMMKVTGEPSGSAPSSSNRPSLPTSLSAPQLHLLKSPSPDSAGTEEDEDEEVPLAILQAHGFPQKGRAPTRLSTMASNPNIRAASQASHRPGSSMGDASSNNDRQRHSTLPAFARGLPQDPFVGAGISRPAVRESLAFGGGNPAPPSQGQGPLPPGGLVGVIASEERSRAMRRGSPNTEAGRFAPSGGQGPGFDPMAGIPPQMMYGQGAMPGMAGMPGMHQMPPMLTPGDQAQIQMTQQMQQFMQMQMQFMQMMSSGQGGQPQMPMQQPYMGQAASQSQMDLSGRQSVMGDFMPEPPRMNGSMRTMSMVQPVTGSFNQHPGYAPSYHSPSPGYTPSIAPSERSNVGLPGRYRPVSQAPASILNQHSRSNTMSGALSQFDGDKKSTINVVTKAGAGSDDDDDEGWEAMKAKRDQKRSMWKTKKEFGGVLDAIS